MLTVSYNKRGLDLFNYFLNGQPKYKWNNGFYTSNISVHSIYDDNKNIFCHMGLYKYVHIVLYLWITQ